MKRILGALIGFGKVYALKGGWHGWVSAGYPTEKTR
jgi:rhodanese-related sulfurtransferase